MRGSLLSALDLSSIDSGVIDTMAPEWVTRQVSQHISTLLRKEPPDSPALRELNELKLRLLSDAIVAVNLLPQDTAPAWAGTLDDWLEGKINRIGGPVLCTPGGLACMLLGNCMVVAFPDLEVNGRTEMALDELSETQHMFPSVNCWVFDMSALSGLPQALIAYLVGLQNASSPQPPRILLLWLKHEAIPASLTAPVMKYFHLMRRGAFLLSKF